jgi:hypothetical protein
VPEWSIGSVSKTEVPARVPGVRIPPSPPTRPAQRAIRRTHWMAELARSHAKGPSDQRPQSGRSVEASPSGMARAQRAQSSPSGMARAQRAQFSPSGMARAQRAQSSPSRMARAQRAQSSPSRMTRAQRAQSSPSGMAQAQRAQSSPSRMARAQRAQSSPSRMARAQRAQSSLSADRPREAGPESRRPRPSLLGKAAFIHLAWPVSRAGRSKPPPPGWREHSERHPPSPPTRPAQRR